VAGIQKHPADRMKVLLEYGEKVVAGEGVE